MRRLTKWHWLLIVGLMSTPFITVLLIKWHEATARGGQTPADPFRIAGNLYYVGASDIAAFLITSPEGHVLIDGGYPGTPPMIIDSITKLGFNIKDVKVLLNSEPHYDHAGGLAELQKASGAELWASDVSATSIESGGDAEETFLPFRVLDWTGITKYDAARVDHRFKDGETVRLGPIALTAHITGGHTRGCTTWTFVVRDHNRDLNVVSACSLVVPPGAKLADPDWYPGIRADFERTFTVLRSLPADIWVTSHARPFGRYRKFVAQAKANNPADPFIDPDGYRAYVDDGEATFRKQLADEKGR